MKFLIVLPRYIKCKDESYSFLSSLGYLLSSLKKNSSHQVEYLDLNYYYNYNEPVKELLAKEIKNKNIDVVCTGGLIVHYNAINLIISSVKEINPDIITITGGGAISCEPELMLKAINFDFGVIGEGEETLVELADCIEHNGNFRNISGIIYKDKNKNIVITQPRRVIENLDSIPFPDYEGLQTDRYLETQLSGDVYYTSVYNNPRMLPIVASRSCPYNCTFCYHPIGKKYRQRSLDNIFKEIDYLVDKYNINILMISDELFCSNIERLEEFCKRINEYKITWYCQLRVDMINKHILRMLKESGCRLISYGLESANNEVLRSLKKYITIEQIEKALKLTEEAELGIRGNFIFGDVAETFETAKETLRWWKEHKNYQISLAFIDIYPGSELYSKAIEKGLIKDKLQYIKDGFPRINITNMNDMLYEELKQACEYYKNNIFYNEVLKLPTNISIEKIGFKSIKGDIFKIICQCPHCHNNIEYKNINVNLPALSSLLCRECNKLFYHPFLLLAHFKITKEVIKNLENKISANKLEVLNSLINKEFSLEDINENLKKSNFTVEEVKLVASLTLLPCKISNKKNIEIKKKSYKYKNIRNNTFIKALERYG